MMSSNRHPNSMFPVMTRSLFNSVKLCIALFLLLVPGLVSAQDFPAEPVGMVNDFANLFSTSEQRQLETKLRNYRDSTTNVIAIATLPDLKGYDIQQVGTQLFNEWKMWHEERYNGVLIVIAPNEREIRIEVGYGLEGAIPDVMAGRIIREVITPEFKQANFYDGVDRATTILIDLAQGEFKGSLSKKRSSKDDDVASIIIFILFVVFVVYSSSRRGGGGKGKRRRTMGPGGFIWLGGSGFGGGSGGGFGGGSFGGFSGGGGFGSGGGGASGGW